MNEFVSQPDDQGYFGNYGGAFVPEQLRAHLEQITAEYQKIQKDEEFQTELLRLYSDYVGRPSPLYFAANLTKQVGGAQIYLKREDLNHTGAHKINHCLGEALLAKRLGKRKVIAETGAGQHGVALATAAAILNLECDIYMGAVDVAKERPNVLRMKLLGARVVTVTSGLQTLKEAVDEAFAAYLEDLDNQFYAIGSVVGPHPFPLMVRDFQSIVGREARQQILIKTNRLPDHLVACVGGGSNAMGLFTAFLNDTDVAMYGVEPGGRSLRTGDNAATLTLGSPGVIHGFKCYLLQDESGQPLPVHSVASGLDYPGVGPEHSYLKDCGRVNYVSVNDADAVAAFFQLARIEGIIPALESAHAVAFALKFAATRPQHETIIVNLSGRGDKDLDYVIDNYGAAYGLS
ncbi:MAG: tryptophan synthase subunit beta [Negativicutes bacterium]|jgi:tryptophan synthase beta chain